MAAIVNLFMFVLVVAVQTQDFPSPPFDFQSEEFVFWLLTSSQEFQPLVEAFHLSGQKDFSQESFERSSFGFGAKLGGAICLLAGLLSSVQKSALRRC